MFLIKYNNREVIAFMEQKSRLGELDALRGLAALAVVFFHYTTFYESSFGYKEGLLFNFKYGYFGVHLFFIISGFVIYMSLPKTSNVKDFIVKRAIRLYPAYIVAVLLTFIITYLSILDKLKTTLKEMLLNLTMFQGVLPIGIKNVDGSYWSLGIEITFYIICSIALLLGIIKKPVLLSTITMLSIFTIKILYQNNLIHPIIGDMGIVNYANLFVAGIMFYQLKNSKNREHIINLVILSTLIYQIIFQGKLSGIFVLGFILIFYGVIFNKLKFLNNNILRYFGTISYSLYLVHQFIGYILINYLENGLMLSNSFILISTPLALSIGLATVITFYIEKPIQKILFLKYKGVNKDELEKNLDNAI